MAKVTIEARPNGPYVVTGTSELRDTNGNVLPTQARTMLCRCGASTKKPFCDGTHSKIGFQAAAQAVPDSAKSPADSGVAAISSGNVAVPAAALDGTESGATGSSSSNVLPNTDLAKIHAEINQLNNQRFLASVAAATLLAALFSRLFPVSELLSTSNDKKGVLISASATCVIYSLVLLAIALQSLRLRKFMRTYSTYLVVKHASEWERDWDAFRNDKNRKHVSYIDNSIHMIVIQICSGANCLANIFLLYLGWDIVNEKGIGIRAAIPWCPSPLFAFVLIFIFLILQEKAIENDKNLKNDWEVFLGTPLPTKRPS